MKSPVDKPESLPGWGQRLFPLYDFAVSRLETGSHFVEVGSFLGMSACYGAQRIQKSGKNIKLDCVDPWMLMDAWVLDRGHEVWLQRDSSITETLEQAREYVLNNGGNCFEAFKHSLRDCGVEKHVDFHNMESEKASHLYPKHSVDFILLDGDHSYDGVFQDLRSWYPKLKPRAFFCGDDFENSHFPGIKKAVCDFFEKPVIEKEEIPEDGLDKRYIYSFPNYHTWLTVK